MTRCRPTVCLSFHRDGLRRAIRENPELAFALLGQLAARVRLLIARLDGVTSQNVPARLAGFLLSRHDAAGEGSFTLGQTQQSVAEDLGTVCEVVVRALRHLRGEGVIAADGGGRYRVMDEGRLRSIATNS